MFRVEARLDRLVQGNLGDWKSVGEGVCELRLHFGPGYRVYFARVGTDVLILLCGGDKRTQKADIAKARKYWKEFLWRNDEKI
jgi:putative addiction module killer protein